MKKIFFGLIIWGTIGISILYSQWNSLMDSNLWEIKGGKGLFLLSDTVFYGVPVKDTMSTFLCTKKQYRNFVLELYVKIDSLINSGIQIRSGIRKDGKVYGLQVEVDPTDRAFSGGIYDEKRRGWLYDLKHSKAKRQAFIKNDWNLYHIEVNGSYIRTWVNGVPIAIFKDTLDDIGFIGLQAHYLKNKQLEGFKVGFKDIKIIEFSDSTFLFDK